MCASESCLSPYPSACLWSFFCFSFSLHISCWTSAHTQHPPPTASSSPSLTTTPKINRNHTENTHSLQLFNPSSQETRGRGTQGSNGEMEKGEKWNSAFFLKKKERERATCLFHHGSTTVVNQKLSEITAMLNPVNLNMAQILQLLKVLYI